MHRLADTPRNHPSLWGDVAVTQASSLIIEDNALILPHLKRRGAPHWWMGHFHGAFNAAGAQIEGINDMRGQRHIFQPSPHLDQIDYDSDNTAHKDLVIYGGTIFDHFGHLLLDLTRLYQLTRLYRHTKGPIWVHVHTTHPGKGVTSPIAQQWLALLGMEERVKVIRRPIRASTLVSSTVLYRDRGFVSADFHAATSTALAVQHRDHLSTIQRIPAKMAYLSRHKLTTGTTMFLQEGELVEKLSRHPEIDIICPEELSFIQKLSLYKQYSLIAGFPQACMNLKAFVPRTDTGDLAHQVMLIAGPNSLSSNWINIDQACNFNDHYIDCPALDSDAEQQDKEGFQRGNSFDVETAYQGIVKLIGRSIDSTWP
jgi:hypothetical protein